MARLRVEGLTKIFPAKPHPVRAVERLSFAVEEGELIVLLGPSGCGKTTTLRLIAGLEKPDSGSIELDGERIDSRKPEARPISLAFQSPALFPQLTVAQNLELGLRLRKAPRAEREKRAAEVLELLQITELAGRLPEQLSGGQQQRVALGRSLATSPKLFLLDEPLASLDPGARLQLREVIKRVQRQTGTAMIYVTHDQVEALALADRIIVMQRGRIKQAGTPVQVYYTPENLFVAQFIGSPPVNLFDGVCEEGKVAIEQLGIELPRPSGISNKRKVIVAVRPEDIRLRTGGRASARITEITPAFPEMYIRLEGEGFTAMVRAPFSTGHQAGDAIFFDLDPAAVHVFHAESGERLE